MALYIAAFARVFSASERALLDGGSNAVSANTACVRSSSGQEMRRAVEGAVVNGDMKHLSLDESSITSIAPLHRAPSCSSRDIARAAAALLARWRRLARTAAMQAAVAAAARQSRGTPIIVYERRARAAWQ